MKTEIEIKLTPKQIAEQIWNLNSDEQAEMFEALREEAGSNHVLMTQFLYCRDACEERGGSALDAFQYMFASAYKYWD